jgi:DNA-binding CsgD family transcriptional regulator
VIGKSDHVRVQDVRAAYRLIGECRDLGSNTALWHQRMFEGLGRLVGVAGVSGGEARWVGPHQVIEPIVAFGAGFDENGRAMYRAYMRELTPGGDPVFRALRKLRGRLVTRARRQLVSDSTWYRSAAWNDYHRPAHIDDRLMSVYQFADNVVNVISLHRAPGEREFSSRERRLVSFFHEELGPLIGHALMSATEPSPDKLSPRLRQALACLLEGDSEKQLAARLALSHATAHQYVTALYRRFGVTSRGQLLAYMLKRAARDSWRSLWSMTVEEPSSQKRNLDEPAHPSP